mmetsp:Transcript_105885/g.297727  ORF Transcript_105885/g.297727 Transcript_105885/m.297727 type:complete len:264 (+) Transcript_105885:172-963(+)
MVLRLVSQVLNGIHRRLDQRFEGMEAHFAQSVEALLLGERHFLPVHKVQDVDALGGTSHANATCHEGVQVDLLSALVRQKAEEMMRVRDFDPQTRCEGQHPGVGHPRNERLVMNQPDASLVHLLEERSYLPLVLGHFFQFRLDGRLEVEVRILQSGFDEQRSDRIQHDEYEEGYEETERGVVRGTHMSKRVGDFIPVNATRDRREHRDHCGPHGAEIKYDGLLDQRVNVRLCFEVKSNPLHEDQGKHVQDAHGQYDRPKHALD